MNKVILIGRLTRDPEIRYSQGDNSMAIARFTLAVDRKKGRNSENNNEQTADFISCTAFDKKAEVIEKYTRQGTKLAIVGHIQTGSYTNKDGQKVYTTDVMVDDIEFCESKGSNNSDNGSRPETAKVSSDGFMNIPDNVEDEGLPFN